MKTVRRLSTLLLFGALLFTGFSQKALAAGTTAGTPISNSATISFAVGGVTQSPVTSAPAAFVVDRKVDLSVTSIGATYTYTAPSVTGAVLAYSVTNEGNAPFNFSFSADNGTVDPFASPNADDIDITFPAGNHIFVESGGDPNAYDSGVDVATSISNLAPDASRIVYVLADIPSGATNNQVAAVILIAQALELDSSALAESSGADTAGQETVFTDGAGDHSSDVARDARHSGTNAFQVRTGYLSIAKSANTIWDPVDLNTNPKAIPLAYVQYTITISHDGTVPFSANLTTLSDTLVSALTFDADLILASASATPSPEYGAGYGFKVTAPPGRAWAGNVGYFTSANDADGASFNGTDAISIDFGTILPGTDPGYTAGELKSGESVTLTFNATIN